ncbi:uncharacterized protein PAC_18523 [Phialocephala subalpina]|uniref:Carrier domain-containing protein n=1 Tax=Phialocephala subalpina TaxID=576137 RepID=A0A1L7XUB6_9HELO|nr:uncharacterized protein PAC_18523 [Phialocephala subalpina]
MIVPSEGAAGMAKHELLHELWPVVQAANRRVKGFSQISLEMIEILDIGTEYPSTDKGILIRAAFYKKFEIVINEALGLEALEVYLLDVYKNKFGINNLDAETDFFQAGVDSLQAITARGHFLLELDLGAGKLGQSAVFEFPNIQSLAVHLFSLRIGENISHMSELDVIEELIHKYSSFARHIPGPHIPDGEVVDNVKAIYCLVRTSNSAAAVGRIISTMAQKNIGTSFDEKKIVCLPTDLCREDLGLESTISFLKKRLTLSYTHHIKETFNILNFCLDVSTPLPARFFFCSSISAAAGTPLPAVIPETYLKELSQAQNMGYARSKLVTKMIIKAAADGTGMLWDSTEAIPLMIQSALNVGALLMLDEVSNLFLSDLHPVGSWKSLVSAILEPAECLLQMVSSIMSRTASHLGGQKIFSPLCASGLKFEAVSQQEWLKRLRNGDPDPEKNPTVKLIDFFAEKYDNEKPGRRGHVFLTEQTSQASRTIENGFDIVETGLVTKFVEYWRSLG